MILVWILGAWLVSTIVFTLGFMAGASMARDRRRGPVDLTGAAARGELDSLGRRRVGH